MNALRLSGLAALILTLSACSTPAPVNYYTLVPPAQASAASRPHAAFMIDVLPVGIPAQLDQQPLVVRNGRSGVMVLDQERWASPLGDEFRNALSDDLTRRLGTQDIAGLDAPKSASVLNIKLEVRRFDAWPGQKVQLDADWSLAFANNAPSARLTCSGRFEAPARGGYGELVRAEQGMIAVMAKKIAADARHWSQTHGAASRADGCL